MNELEELIKKYNPKININGRICHHRINVLYSLTEKYNLENYLEIGVHNGSSMAYVLQSNKNKNCIGIDPFETFITDDPEMIHYQKNDKITERKTLTNIENNNKYNSKIKLIKKLSKDINDTEIEHEIDLFFIDGDHSFNSVLNDYNKYFKFIKKGGYIVFDDLHQKGPNKAFNYVLKNDKNIKLFGIYKETEGILVKL